MFGPRIRLLPALVVPLVLALIPVIEQCQRELAKNPLSPLNALEMFSGEEAITRMCNDQGLHAEGTDIIKGKSHDLTTKAGVKTVVKLVCRLQPESCIWAAPLCSSWVWVTRDGTERSSSHPAGNSDVPRVLEGNKMVTNLVAIFGFAFVLGHHLFLEQPPTSLMRQYEPMKSFISGCLKYTIRTWLGAFSASTPKPIDVLSTDKEIETLRRPEPKDLQLLCKPCKTGLRGKKKAMTESQAYPLEFGRHVAKLYKTVIKKGKLKTILPRVLRD
jgi:hypothetical protein